MLVGLSGFHGGVIVIPGPGTDMFDLHHHPADIESCSYSGSRKQFKNNFKILSFEQHSCSRMTKRRFCIASAILKNVGIIFLYLQVVNEDKRNKEHIEAYRIKVR